METPFPYLIQWVIHSNVSIRSLSFQQERKSRAWLLLSARPHSSSFYRFLGPTASGVGGSSLVAAASDVGVSPSVGAASVAVESSPSQPVINVNRQPMFSLDKSRLRKIVAKIPLDTQ